MQVDSNIAYFRKKANLTQKEFSKIINIKRYYYSFIETKTFMPGPELAERIAFELKTTMSQLWTKAELNYILSKQK